MNGYFCTCLAEAPRDSYIRCLEWTVHECKSGYELLIPPFFPPFWRSLKLSLRKCLERWAHPLSLMCQSSHRKNLQKLMESSSGFQQGLEWWQRKWRRSSMLLVGSGGSRALLASLPASSSALEPRVVAKRLHRKYQCTHGYNYMSTRPDVQSLWDQHFVCYSFHSGWPRLPSWHTTAWCLCLWATPSAPSCSAWTRFRVAAPMVLARSLPTARGGRVRWSSSTPFTRGSTSQASPRSSRVLLDLHIPFSDTVKHLQIRHTHQ